MKIRIILGLLLFSSHLFAAAGNTIGTVLFTTDKVVVEQNHKQRAVTRGAPLYSGDTIITNATGQAKIKYNNGSLVTIRPNSNYVTSPATGQKNGELNATLNKGTIDYSSTGKKKQGTIHTPVVSLAILGTQFTLSYSELTQETIVIVLSGIVSMNNQIITGGATGTASSNGKVTKSTTSSSGSSNSGGASTSTFATASAAQTTSISTTTSTGVSAGTTASAAATTATISIACTSTP